MMKPLLEMDAVVLAADFHIGRIYRYAPPDIACKFPLLVIGGADDRITPPRFVRQLYSLSTQTRGEILPGAGHMLIYEKTRQVANRLVDFLESVTDRA